MKPAADHDQNALLRRFADLLRAGEVIAFPTETVYGLLARVDSPAALQRIFELKGRRENNPMPVIVAEVEAALMMWVDVPAVAHRLIDALWPGPLTIVLPAARSVADLITGGTGAVGARVPGSAAARGITAMVGVPLVATSANPSGQRPAMSPAEVRAYFGDQLPVPEGPTLPHSKGSTVLDLRPRPPVLLREGEVSRARIESVLGVRLASK
jgi:L-threonylcarbamoyladenylate synthase